MIYRTKWGKNLFPFFFQYPRDWVISYLPVRHLSGRFIRESCVKKIFVFAGLFLISCVVVAVLSVLSQEGFKDLAGARRWVSVIPGVFVVVLMLRPLENVLRGVSDRVLFQKKYDYKHSLRMFSNEVNTILYLDMLVKLTVCKLVDIMKLENVVIMLYDEAEKFFYVSASEGVVMSGIEIASGDRIIDVLKMEGKYIRLDNGQISGGIGDAEKDIIRELDSAMILPLSHRNEMVGMLSLGKKKSDEEFTEDDLDILEPLARTLSIAIVNAQLFEKLSEAQARAAQREKMAVIGTLSAGINHEICNPLGIARGQCEMFLLNLKEGIYNDKSHEELLEKAQTIMDKVIREMDRATVITRKLSSFAKPSRDSIRDDVDVAKEIEEVISLVEYDLNLDDISVEQDIEPDLPPIAADPKQVQEIFFNIMRNAAQAMEGVGTIIMAASSAGKSVFIEIKDSGKGISFANLGKIFDPFFSTKDPGSGTGLGLFIVKQIVEHNGGKISVESEQGEGTVVRLEFPVSCVERMKVE
ncbi:MAG: ATP-binding protein [Candidatus Tantalella remota]|nr:ATP-binding protein [Candidatus Tantalella remota]